MRKNIYELIAEETCKPAEEIQRLVQLFEEEKIWFSGMYTHSLKYYIDKCLFRNLPIRGTSLCIDDLKKRLGILNRRDMDGLLSYCEFIYNILIQSINEIENEPKIDEQIRTIEANIKWILERMNHKLVDSGDNKRIIVEKNKQAAQAASFVDDSTKAIKIIEYNHIGLKGDLLKKQSILKQIGDIVEPILKSHVLKNNDYDNLENDAGFLLNNFQIRHENKTGANQKKYIAEIDNSDLEDWYDKAYNTLLMVIIANDQIEVSSKLRDLKQEYKW
jgi:hypothetical protein